jgi:opacity protein-like surface antigen
MKTLAVGCLLFSMFLAHNAAAQTNLIEFAVPGLIYNSYDESFDRPIREVIVGSGGFNTPQWAHEISGRYTHQFQNSIGVGFSVESRKYDKGHGEVHVIDADGFVDFNTNVFGILGFIRISGTDHRFVPYSSLGAGFLEITARDTSTYTTGYFEQNIVVIHGSDKFDLHKLGLESFDGLQFKITRNFSAGAEFNLLWAPDTLRSIGGGIVVGVSW